MGKSGSAGLPRKGIVTQEVELEILTPLVQFSRFIIKLHRVKVNNCQLCTVGSIVTAGRDAATLRGVTHQVEIGHFHHAIRGAFVSFALLIFNTSRFWRCDRDGLVEE